MNGIEHHGETRVQEKADGGIDEADGRPERGRLRGVEEKIRVEGKTAHGKARFFQERSVLGVEGRGIAGGIGPGREPGIEIDAPGQERRAPRRDPPRRSGGKDQGENRAEGGGRPLDYFHLTGFAVAGMTGV